MKNTQNLRQSMKHPKEKVIIDNEIYLNLRNTSVQYERRVIPYVRANLREYTPSSTTLRNPLGCSPALSLASLIVCRK